MRIFHSTFNFPRTYTDAATYRFERHCYQFILSVSMNMCLFSCVFCFLFSWCVLCRYSLLNSARNSWQIAGILVQDSHAFDINYTVWISPFSESLYILSMLEYVSYLLLLFILLIISTSLILLILSQNQF